MKEKYFLLITVFLIIATTGFLSGCNNSRMFQGSVREEPVQTNLEEPVQNTPEDLTQDNEEDPAPASGEGSVSDHTEEVQTTEVEIPASAKRTEADARSAADYAAAGVDELNSIPILMYHGIYDMSNAETEYVGGNVDEDGYLRTCEAFEADLEYYYEMGYRMIRLTDYVDGKIDTAFGYSPLIITFDDGDRDVVLEGFADDGTPIFDPTCAIGILEKMKKKYPDYNVTASFFINNWLFGNGEENDRIVIKWMVENGYDIGNHTWNHAYLDDCSVDEMEFQVGAVYKMLDEIIPGQYINILAYPFGAPALSSDTPEYQKMFEGTYEGFHYTTKAALQCAWTRSNSPFHCDVEMYSLRRIRGYDNNGELYDIQQNFNELNAGTRYISDGDPDTIVIHKEDEEWLGNTYGHEVICY